MINSVRQTVLSVLNKNNYGYITPADFNLYAKQAQLEIFDEYFYSYNNQVNKENARRSGTDYAQITKALAEVIDTFSVTNALKKTSLGVTTFNSNFYLPSPSTTGDDEYMINKLMVYTTQLATGSASAVVVDSLRDSTANFVSSGVSVGDLVVNSSDETFAYVTSVSELTLGLSSDIFTSLPKSYRVYDSDYVKQADRVSHGNITMLNNSLLTKPSATFPAYTQANELITIYPQSIVNYGQVVAQYIRYPKDPNWTYSTLTGDEPVFDGTASDYQDFELPLDDEYSLVYKILQYSGMSIREVQAVQFGQAQEQAQNISEQ